MTKVISAEEMQLMSFQSAMKKVLTEFWNDKILENPELAKRYCTSDAQAKEVEEWLTRRGNVRYKYCMFTINPREGVDIINFLAKVRKACKKKWISNYIWCAEWRSEKEGFHVHIRTENNKAKKPSEMKREMFSTFKNFVDNKLHVNMRGSTKEDAFINYVKGTKKGKPKPNALFDIQNRHKWKIPNFITGTN